MQGPTTGPSIDRFNRFDSGFQAGKKIPLFTVDSCVVRCRQFSLGYILLYVVSYNQFASV